MNQLGSERRDASEGKHQMYHQAYKRNTWYSKGLQLYGDFVSTASGSRFVTCYSLPVSASWQ